MKLRSALFNILFILYTLVLGTIGLPFALAYRPYALTVARSWAYGSLWLLRVLCGITHEIHGRENLPEGPVLLASKHQSAWETIIFWAVLKRPTFVLKRDLIFIPVFGWHLLLLKCIYIDRSAGASAIKKMLREARIRVDENRAIVIFPEGTRAAPGAETTYHPGVAALYQNLGIPVVPVALNSGLHWGRQAFVKTPGVITLQFLPAIQPGMKGRDFLPLLKEQVDTASNALLNK